MNNLDKESYDEAKLIFDRIINTNLTTNEKMGALLQNIRDYNKESDRLTDRANSCTDRYATIFISKRYKIRRLRNALMGICYREGYTPYDISSKFDESDKDKPLNSPVYNLKLS